MRSTLQAPAAGFSLVELALVLLIVGILMLSLMSTLSSQIDQRSIDDTRRRLEQARELVLSFAIVNGRLPCPATAASSGDESPAGGGAGAACTTYYGGWLPARAIGFQQADSSGFAVDAWGNRIRYAVSATTWGTTRFTKQHNSSPATDAWLVTTTPSDLVICGSATGITGTTCNTAPSVTNQNVVVAIIFSTGKNGAPTPCATCLDERANTIVVDPVFVFHTPTSSGAANGEFDDQMTWITVGELYGKLIAAGQLP